MKSFDEVVPISPQGPPRDARVPMTPGDRLQNPLKRPLVLSSPGSIVPTTATGKKTRFDDHSPRRTDSSHPSSQPSSEPSSSSSSHSPSSSSNSLCSVSLSSSDPAMPNAGPDAPLRSDTESPEKCGPELELAQDAGFVHEHRGGGTKEHTWRRDTLSTGENSTAKPDILPPSISTASSVSSSASSLPSSSSSKLASSSAPKLPVIRPANAAREIARVPAEKNRDGDGHGHGISGNSGASSAAQEKAPRVDPGASRPASQRKSLPRWSLGADDPCVLAASGSPLVALGHPTATLLSRSVPLLGPGRDTDRAASLTRLAELHVIVSDWLRDAVTPTSHSTSNTASLASSSPDRLASSSPARLASSHAARLASSSQAGIASSHAGIASSSSSSAANLSAAAGAEFARERGVSGGRVLWASEEDALEAARDVAKTACAEWAALGDVQGWRWARAVLRELEAKEKHVEVAGILSALGMTA